MTPPSSSDELSHDEADRVAEAIRLHLLAPVRAIERLPGRSRNLVYLVELPDRRVVLKVLGARKVSTACTFATEALHRAGIPTPAILAVDGMDSAKRRDLFGLPYMIFEHVDGERFDRWTWNRSKEEIAPLVEQLGQLLGILHSIPTLGGFGRIDDEGHGEFPSWIEGLRGHAFRRPSGEEVRPLDTGRLKADEVLRPEAVELVDAIFRPEHELFRLDEPRLLHNDLTLKNVLIDPDELRVTAILDLHNASSGDPALDLARFQYFYEDRGYHEALLRGRGATEAADEARRLALLVFVLLEKITWLEGRDQQFPGRLQADRERLETVLADPRLQALT